MTWRLENDLEFAYRIIKESTLSLENKTNLNLQIAFMNNLELQIYCQDMQHFGWIRKKTNQKDVTRITC